MQTNTTAALGPVQAQYRVHAAKNRVNLLIGRLLVVLGPLLLLFSAYRQFAGEPDGLNVLCGGVGLILLLMGAYALWEQRRDRSVSLTVHPEGMVYTRSGKTDVLRWDEVESARMSVTNIRSSRGRTALDTVYGYTITLAGGPEVNFRFNKNSIRNIDELSNRIQQEVTWRKLPEARAALQAGRAVQFGRLSVDQQGISNGKEHIPWNEVEEVKVAQGAITVRKKGKWLNWSNAAVSETPNVFVFLALVDGVMKQRPDLAQGIRV